MNVLSNRVFTLATGCFVGSGHLEVCQVYFPFIVETIATHFSLMECEVTRFQFVECGAIFSPQFLKCGHNVYSFPQMCKLYIHNPINRECREKMPSVERWLPYRSHVPCVASSLQDQIVSGDTLLLFIQIT